MCLPFTGVDPGAAAKTRSKVSRVSARQVGGSTDAPARPDGRRSAALPRGLLILLGLAATTVTIAGMKAAAGILAPAFLALMLAIVVDPLRGALARRGLPRWVGTLLVIVGVYVGLLLFGASLVIAGARFATLMPTYQEELADVLDGARVLLSDLGVGNAQISRLVGEFDLSRVAGLVTAVIGQVLSLLTNLAFIATLVLFISVDARAFSEHLGRVRGDHEGFVEALLSFAHGTRRYLVVSTVFGLIVAVLDTGLLWLLGIPGAVLWGLLAFITNYIPNIGFLIGLVPPAVLALLEGGPGLMVGVVVAYSLINVVIQSVIQPKVVGDAVGISASVTFLSLVVWAWILGPLGAVLAVPLTLLVKALMVDVDPGARWVAGLIGDGGESSGVRRGR
jgi:AI-2 transport protein TqsA